MTKATKADGPTADEEIERRVNLLRARAAESGGEMTRDDALSRIRSAAANDVPRLKDELATYKAQAAKHRGKRDNRDPGKKESHAATIAQGEAMLQLERAILDELGGSGPASTGTASTAHDAGVNVQEA